MILALAALFVAGTITTITFVSAAPPEDNPGKPFDAILEKLDAIIAAIGAIDISGIGLNPTTQTQIDNIDTVVTNIEAKLDNSDFGLDAIDNTQYVPFIKRILPSIDGGFTCAPAGSSDFDTLVINNVATSGSFVVTSIVIVPVGVNEGIDTLTLSGPSVDGVSLNMVTTDRTGTVGINRGFELMGSDLAGIPGTWPLQFVSDGVGDDIRISINCDSGNTVDLNIQQIVVAGWKQADTTINVEYKE